LDVELVLPDLAQPSKPNLGLRRGIWLAHLSKENWLAQKSSQQGQETKLIILSS